MNNLSGEQLETILCNTVMHCIDGVEVYKRYSGRCMYGAQCPGLTCEGPGQFALAMMAVECADEDIAEQLCRAVRTDSMGRDAMIYYWPHITYKTKANATEED